MNREFPNIEKGVADSATIEELKEEDIEKMIKEVTEKFAPFREEIEKLRKVNTGREVGGKISKGQLILFDESKWKENFVIGESPEKEREMAEKGTLSFHTHPDHGFTNESGMDILAAYYRYCETFFHKEGASSIIALKKLSVEKIREIDRQAWNQAEVYEQESGDPAYWFWKGILKDKLPTRTVTF